MADFLEENTNLKIQCRSLFLYFIYPQRAGDKISLKQISIKLDVAYKIKNIWVAMTKVAEAAKCLLTVVLWVTEDVQGADVFHFA